MNMIALWFDIKQKRAWLYILIFCLQSIQKCFVIIWTITKVISNYFRNENFFKRHKYNPPRASNIEIFELVHTSLSSSLWPWYALNILTLRKDHVHKTSLCGTAFFHYCWCYLNFEWDVFCKFPLVGKQFVKCSDICD